MQTKRTVTMILAGWTLVMTTACIPQTGDDLLPTPDPDLPTEPENPDNPEQPDNPPTNEAPPKDITGVWEHQTGTLKLIDPFFGNVRFISFEPTGIVRFSNREDESNILNCQDGVFTQVSDDAVILDGGEDLFAARSFFGTRLALFEMPDDDTLKLVDNSSGDSASFRRVAAIPEEDKCGDLNLIAEFNDLDESFAPGGLAFDGTSLWYTRGDDRKIVPVDPQSGAAGTPITFTPPFNVIGASQDADFWTFCDCNNSDVAKRVTAAGTVVDPIPEIVTGINLRTMAVAFDPVLKTVWLHGENTDDDFNSVFFQIDAEQEPDVLVSQFKFAYEFDAIAHDGEFLYGLSRFPEVIVKIDPVSGKAVKTYVLPDRALRWRGLAVVDGDFFILAREPKGNNRGVIIRFRPE